MAQDIDFLDNILGTILDTVSEGMVIVDHRGMVRHINAYAAEILGVSLAWSKGKHFRQVFCPSLPPDRCWVNFALSRGQTMRQHRFEVEDASGRKRNAIANFTPFKLPNHETAAALIALRFEDEATELRQEREKQRAIMSSLAEGLFTVDNEWRITSFNRAAEEITGWSEQEALGKYCNQIFKCENCAEKCPITETLKRSRPIFDYDMQMQHRKGHKIPVSVNTTILYNSSGEAIGGVMSFRDCSVERQMQEKLLHQTSYCGIVGKNKRMLEVYSLIQEIADSKATVLILGESGTGKELIANAIQKLSPRKNKPYIKVNCAAIPDALLESELFGHVKGAFTDAYADRVGRFEMADGGTIFLDEVGDLTPPAQLSLLRVLEEGEFQRLGSSETIKVDVRVIAATNRDLWQLVQEGKFRDDLYYRLNVIPIHLPPLRERRDDLPILIDHFMQKYRRITAKPISDFSDQAYDLLMAYDYPGNVRELENIIEHAFARTHGNIITENKLPYYVRQFHASREKAPQNGAEAEEDDAARIRQVLMQCHWNRSLAAKRLGMSRTTLWRKMKELDLFEKVG